MADERGARAASAVVAALSVMLATANAQTVDYPGATWVAAPACNFSTADTTKDTVVIHTIEGTALGAVNSTFQNCSNQSSVHYVVSESGQVWQMVRENKLAWHVTCYNDRAVGIEHEGYAGAASHPDKLYRTSAALTRSICDRWGIPKVRATAGGPGIMGHKDVNDCCCHGDHWDPGPGWDWDGFIRRVNLQPLLSFDYNSFDTNSTFNYVGGPGMPTLLNGRLRLTSATGWMTCAAWYADRMMVRNGFEANFDFQITDPGGVFYLGQTGGDGMSFVIQDSSGNALGDHGGSMGYTGVSKCVAVEFDTYPNPEHSDPNANHISVHTGYEVPNSSNHGYSLGSTTNIPDLSSGQVYHARIVYQPNQLRVYLDGALKLEVPLDLHRAIQSSDGGAWVGFTATSVSAWENHDILNFSLRSVPENAGQPVPPPPTYELPTIQVNVDQLWQWNPTQSRFEDPSGPVTLNAQQPTYLLAHGWDGGLASPRNSMSSAACAIQHARPGANIIAWDWSGPANPNGAADFPQGISDTVMQALQNPWSWQTLLTNGTIVDAWKAANNSRNQGDILGYALSRYASLGSELHLIAHSHGGGVLGRAARIMVQRGLHVNSITTLDSAHIGCVPYLGCLIDPLGQVDPATADQTAVAYYDQRLPDGGNHGMGFGGPLPAQSRLTNMKLNPGNAASLPTLLATWIAGLDNGVCPPDAGWFPISAWDPGSSGPRALSFNAQQVASVLSVSDFPDGQFGEGGLYQFTTLAGRPVAQSSAFETIEPDLPGTLLVFGEPFDSADSWTGTHAELLFGLDPNDVGNGMIVLSEVGDASLHKKLDWPADGQILTFDYMFRDPRGEESLTVYLEVGEEQKVIYYDNAATSLAVGQMTSSGPITDYVSHVAGTAATLTFVLRTDGADGGSMLLDNIRVLTFSAAGQVAYVKSDATGASNGTSWVDAYTDLQAALNDPSFTGGEIWVAAGTYVPGPQRTDSFALRSGVSIYGGFAGIETAREQRNPVARPTVLSGDIGVSGDSNDNCYHVVTAIGVDGAAVLDGFLVTGGNADGTGISPPENLGGGLLALSGGPTVANCVFANNRAASAQPDGVARGGGAYIENSGGAGDYALSRCAFVNNTAEAVDSTSQAEGGGLYLTGPAAATTRLEGCWFAGNQSLGYGGGEARGAGLCIHDSTAVLTNCLIRNNYAGGAYADGQNGGGLFARAIAGTRSIVLMNCTVGSNLAYGSGAGVTTVENGSAATLSATNCVFWDNYDIAGGYQGEPAQIAGTAVSVNYSCVQGWTGTLAGTGSFGDDPLLIDDLGPDGLYGTADDEVLLAQGSPCIDRGDNGAVPPELVVDIAGRPRVQHCRVDIGASESPLFDDCNGNGVGDACDLINGDLHDCNGDGTADDCPNAGSWRLYVDDSATGANNGATWADAYMSLQAALAAAACAGGPAEVWVAEGTYKPTTGTDRLVSFQLRNNLALYGGFAGDENSIEDRDPAAHPSILSGDIGAVGVAPDNTYQIATAMGTDETAILDGFTITGGYANGPGTYPPPLKRGGGIYASGASLTVTGCTFVANTAEDDGGGFFSQGGMPNVQRCVFRANIARRGAGFYNSNGGMALTDCSFIGNTGSTEGGAVGNYLASDREARFTNCLFSGNKVTASYSKGGAVYNWGYYGHTFTNCTFSHNRAEGWGQYGGGAMFDWYCYPVITNCILWDNSDWDGTTAGSQIRAYQYPPTVSYSCIQGGWSGTDNLTTDPLFVDADGADNVFGTMDDDLRLQAGSLCIDTGNSNAVPPGVISDLAGRPRIADGDGNAQPVVDMGAYELLTTAATAWSSLRAHGGDAGNIALALNPSGSPSSEPRLGGITSILVDFSLPVEPLDGSLGVDDVAVTDSSGAPYTPADVLLYNDGTHLEIVFNENDLPDGERYRFDLADRFRGVGAVVLLGDLDCEVRSLVGDVNNTGNVNLIDLAAIKSFVGQTADALTGRYDPNADGLINLIDVGLAKFVYGNAAP